MSTTPRHPRRRMRALATVAGVGAALAMLLGTAIPAAAQTQPTDQYRPVLPVDAAGVLGNPANIVPAARTDQAITIPAGAAAGTQLRNQPADGSGAQVWQFALTGFDTVHFTHTVYGGGGAGTETTDYQMPVWKIINQQGGNRTCMDANGSTTIGVGTAVDFFGCDQYGNNQPNQLWIVVDPWVTWKLGDGGEGSPLPLVAPELFANTSRGQVALVSYATYLANGKDLSKALVVSGAQQLVGSNSPLTLQPQQDWPASNKLWNLRDMNPAPQPGTTPDQPGCSSFGCLVG